MTHTLTVTLKLNDDATKLVFNDVKDLRLELTLLLSEKKLMPNFLL